MRWEYRVLKFAVGGTFTTDVDDASLARTLNTLGRDGWEVVSAAGVHSNGYTHCLVFTLKRPLIEARDAEPPHPLEAVQP